jgi:hypothetical protein
MSISQWLLDVYEEKILNFHLHVINLQQWHSYILSQTENADQMPVYFEMPLDTTVNKKGEKSVVMRTGGSENQRYTLSYVSWWMAENCHCT